MIWESFEDKSKITAKTRGITMKLLSINASNTKIAKTQKGEKIPTRLASLSLYPDDIICAGSKAAKCQDGCLVSAGRGRFDNVANARRAKTAFFHADQSGFIDQLKKELANFDKLMQAPKRARCCPIKYH